MTFPLAGAAIDDGVTTNPIPMPRRVANTIFFIVTSFVKVAAS